MLGDSQCCGQIKVRQMSGGEHETLESRIIFEGKVVRLYVDLVRLPNGVEAEREVIRHWGAVGMVPIDEDGCVFMVRQHRHATGEELVEIPAGKLDPGEDPLDCGKRELMEEIGYSAAEWLKLAVFYTSPGFSDEILHLYLARDLREGTASPEEDEFLEIMHLPLSEALRMVSRGDIKDSKTVAGLSLSSMYLEGKYSPSI
jgi:ADP-ribose pyrophosphatase